MALIECVPNFSEGRDSTIIEAIAQAINSNKGVYLLHKDIGSDANRTVFTFVGEPYAVINAAYDAIVCAVSRIDMRKHQGVHPRIGACDVCPIIPIADIGIDACKLLAEELAAKVADLGVPIYMYAENARTTERKELSFLRRGEYEGLLHRIQENVPDYGTYFNARSGATVIGARTYMLAYNVNLTTKDVAIAKAIAARVRAASGLEVLYPKYEKIKSLKAIGWYMPEHGCSQVSTNMYDTVSVGMHDVYEAIKFWAAYYGVEVHGSELIGLSPYSCILAAGKYYKDDADTEGDILEAAIQGLGLDTLKDFNAEEKILEWKLQYMMDIT